MTQYGFFIDQSRCIGCNTCTVACMQWHDIQPGSVRWMRVYQWEKGGFPNTRLHMLPAPCYHCENPVCIKACSNGAIYKEKKYGAVLVDQKKCTGSRACWKACPYGSPQFDSDEPGRKMSKCNMCIDRLEQGGIPICAASCSMRALDFGPIKELEKKYGELRSLEDMPKGSLTRPAVVFKPVDPKSTVVPYNTSKALKLWQKRQSPMGEPLPDIFTTESEVTETHPEIVGRNKLVLKAKNSKELKYYTTDNE
jgi:anaerobic dimethyl sulfoxide reductase subunit B (iron-sulfur subunit)